MQLCKWAFPLLQLLLLCSCCSLAPMLVAHADSTGTSDPFAGPVLLTLTFPGTLPQGDVILNFYNALRSSAPLEFATGTNFRLLGVAPLEDTNNTQAFRAGMLLPEGSIGEAQAFSDRFAAGYVHSPVFDLLLAIQLDPVHSDAELGTLWPWPQWTQPDATPTPDPPMVIPQFPDLTVTAGNQLAMILLSGSRPTNASMPFFRSAIGTDLRMDLGDAVQVLTPVVEVPDNYTDDAEAYVAAMVFPSAEMVQTLSERLAAGYYQQRSWSLSHLRAVLSVSAVSSVADVTAQWPVTSTEAKALIARKGLAAASEQPEDEDAGASTAIARTAICMAAAAAVLMPALWT